MSSATNAETGTYALLNNLLKNALNDEQVMTELKAVLPRQLSMLFPGVPALQENNNKGLPSVTFDKNICFNVFKLTCVSKGEKNFYIWKVDDQDQALNEKKLQETLRNAALVVGKTI
jgi:hypothetical protein